MFKKITFATVLSISINSAHADWSFRVTEDPMSDGKTATMTYYATEISSFSLWYTCINNQNETRYFTISLNPPMNPLVIGEQPERIRVRLDRGKIHTIDFEPRVLSSADKFLMFHYNPDSSSEKQQFAEFEKDLFHSLSRFVFEVKGETRVLETGNAQEAAKKIIEVCGTSYDSK